MKALFVDFMAQLWPCTWLAVPIYFYSENNLQTRQLKEIINRYEKKKQRDLWILSDGHCFKNQVLNFCNMDSMETFKNVHFQSGTLETLKALVEKVHGYTFLPQLNIDNLSAGEKKQVRCFKPLSPSREVSLVFLRSHWKKDIIQSLKKSDPGPTSPFGKKKSGSQGSGL